MKSRSSTRSSIRSNTGSSTGSSRRSKHQQHPHLAFSAQRVEASQKALPEVREQRPVHGVQALFGGRVDRDVELRHWPQIRDLLRKLGVGHQERRDLALVQQPAEFVNVRVDYRLAHQRQRAVLGHRVGQPLRLHSGHASQLLHHIAVQLDAGVHQHLRLVRLPAPLAPHRVLVVPPAEHALVGAGQ